MRLGQFDCRRKNVVKQSKKKWTPNSCEKSEGEEENIKIYNVSLQSAAGISDTINYRILALY